MHVQRSCNLCCHGNATILSPSVVFRVDVAVNNVKMFSVAVEIQQKYCCLATKYFVLLLTIVSMQYSVCVCVCVSVCVCIHLLLTRHANRIFSEPFYIVISAAYLSLPDIFHVMSQTAQFSGGGGGVENLLNKKRVFCFILQLMSETFLILRRLKRDIIINVHIGFHVKYLSFLSHINQTWSFWTDFKKILNFVILRMRPKRKF
jgi:hypothetical protein